MINFDDVTGEIATEHEDKHITLSNKPIVNYQLLISKYQLLINKRGNVGSKHCNEPKAFIEYSAMDDIY